MAGDVGGVECAGGGPDEQIRLDAAVGERLQHAHLDGAEAATAGQDDCGQHGWWRPALPPSAALELRVATGYLLYRQKRLSLEDTHEALPSRETCFRLWGWTSPRSTRSAASRRWTIPSAGRRTSSWWSAAG